MEYFNPRNLLRQIFGFIIYNPLQMIRKASTSIFTTVSNAVFRRIFSSKPSIDFPKTSTSSGVSNDTKIPIEEGTQDILPEEVDCSEITHKLKRPSIESIKDIGPPSKIVKLDKNKLNDELNNTAKDTQTHTMLPLSKQVQKTLDRNKNKQQKRNKKTDNEEPPPPERVNYFVAFQVNNPDIVQAVEEVQRKMLEKKISIKNRKGVPEELSSNVFKDSMVRVQKLHFTLHVLYLKDDEDKAKATTALEKVWTKYRPQFLESPMNVKIEGMGNFSNSVLFANLKGEEHISRLTELAENLREEFEAMNIYGEKNSKAFRPHMTIAKLSRSKTLYKKNIKSFPKEMWTEDFDINTHNFGLQKVESLQLLSMQDKPDPETGYYKCLVEFKFD